MNDSVGDNNHDDDDEDAVDDSGVAECVDVDVDVVDVEDAQCGISHMSELGLDWMGKNHAVEEEHEEEDDDDGINGAFFV